MRNTLYTLEDYFETLAGDGLGPVSRPAALFASFVCGILGDALKA